MCKYGLGLVLAHQHMAQLDEVVRDAILGNVGTIIAFRVGLGDAELLEFFPEFGASDFVNLPNYHVYMKLMINGVVSKPFSAETIASAITTHALTRGTTSMTASRSSRGSLPCTLPS